ncbi:MAG TPA: hypothetical protein VIM98_08880 [Dyella sp.]|uniref:hypothetical protein n=1 Tax=Dyella sp. TaxID=1869338 RepID=UPI002F92E10E
MTFAFATLSNRAELPLSASDVASLDARTFLNLGIPNALHALRGHYDGPSSVVEAYLYLGAIPSLMLLGLPQAWREPRQRRHLYFFAGVAGLAILYMMGTHAPFYGWLYAGLPGIKLFRRPADAAYLFNMAFAFAIGWLASHIDRSSPRPIGRLLLVAAARLIASSPAMRGDGAGWDFATTDFAKTVLLTPRDKVDRELAQADASRCTGQLQLAGVSASPTQLTIQAQASGGPAWLVLSELDFPGWTAQANGVPLAVHRANGMFRAVCVPVGSQKITMQFHPWSMVGEALKKQRSR